MPIASHAFLEVIKKEQDASSTLHLRKGYLRVVAQASNTTTWEVEAGSEFQDSKNHIVI